MSSSKTTRSDSGSTDKKPKKPSLSQSARILFYPATDAEIALDDYQIDICRQETQKSIFVNKITPRNLSQCKSNEFETKVLYESSFENTTKGHEYDNCFTAKELGVSNDLYKHLCEQDVAQQQTWIQSWYIDLCLCAGNKHIAQPNSSYDYVPTPVTVKKPIYQKPPKKVVNGKTVADTSVDLPVIDHKEVKSTSIQWVDNRMVVPKGHFAALLPSSAVQALLNTRIRKREQMSTKATLLAEAVKSFDENDLSTIKFADYITSVGQLAAKSGPVLRKQIETFLNSTYESIAKGRKSMWPTLVTQTHVLFGYTQLPEFTKLLREQYPRVQVNGVIQNPNLKARVFDFSRNLRVESISYAEKVKGTMYNSLRKMREAQLKQAVYHKLLVNLNRARARKDNAKAAIDKAFMNDKSNPLGETWYDRLKTKCHYIFVIKPLRAWDSFVAWWNRD